MILDHAPPPISKVETEYHSLHDHHSIYDIPTRSTATSSSSWEKSSHKIGSSSKKSIYVYDYSKDKLKRIKDGDDFVHQKGIKQIPIPLKPGRLPIRIDGTENIAAFVNISAELRFLRWIGAQSVLYVVGSCD